MAVTRFTDGDVTVTLGGAVEDYVRRLARATHNGALVVLEAEAEAVRAKAEADWYSADVGVTEKTGRSGRVGVVTTVGPAEIRVAIGSRDLARAKYIRRPGPLSVIRVPGTWAEWWEGLPAESKAWHKARQKEGAYKTKSGKVRPTKEAPNPKASDGKYLLQELIGKPTRQILRKMRNLLPTEIDAQMRNGRRA